MQKVLDRMIELEDSTRPWNCSETLWKMQENLDEQTQQRHKQKIRDLLKE